MQRRSGAEFRKSSGRGETARTGVRYTVRPLKRAKPAWWVRDCVSRVGPPNLDEGPITLSRQAQPITTVSCFQHRGPPSRWFVIKCQRYLPKIDLAFRMSRKPTNRRERKPATAQPVARIPQEDG